MADVTNLDIRIERDLKAKADKLFSDMGMSLTTAVNVFVRQAVFEQAIPFKIDQSSESVAAAGTERKRAAMQEIRELLADLDGEDIDLNQIRTERRAAKYESAN